MGKGLTRSSSTIGLPHGAENPVSMTHENRDHWRQWLYEMAGIERKRWVTVTTPFGQPSDHI